MSVFYHNITKKLFNITDQVDFIESLDEGDVVMYTEAGNAILHPVNQEAVNELARKKTDFIKELLHNNPFKL